MMHAYEVQEGDRFDGPDGYVIFRVARSVDRDEVLAEVKMFSDGSIQSKRWLVNDFIPINPNPHRTSRTPRRRATDA